MKGKQGLYASLILIISISTQRILGLKGLTTASIIFVAILAMTLSISFTVFVNRRNAFGGKLNIISSAIMLAMGTFLSISMIIYGCFSRFSDEHVILTSIIALLAVVSFFVAVIFWVWNVKKYSKNQNK